MNALKKLKKEALRKLLLKKVAEPQNSVNIIFNECFKNHLNLDLAKKINNFKRKVHLRSYHYPVQYLCSSWPFRNLDLLLKKSILIPRFQTEHMVDIIIQRVKQKYPDSIIPGLKFVQFGCGSGALGLSIHKELGLSGVMIDIEHKCIDITIKNAIKNNCVLSNLQIFQEDMQNQLQLVNQIDIVVSNPPYLSENHYKKYLSKQVKLFEDKNALVGGQDGLKYIKMLTNQWKQRTRPGLLILEYDGRYFQNAQFWLNQHVILDQYKKRRFILLEK